MTRQLVMSVGAVTVALILAGCGGSAEPDDRGAGTVISSAGGVITGAAPTDSSATVSGAVVSASSAVALTETPVCLPPPAPGQNFEALPQPGSASARLDAASAIAGVLCRYDQDADGAYALTDSAPLDANSIAAIAAALDRVRPVGESEILPLTLYAMHDTVLVNSPAGQVRVDVQYGEPITIAAPSGGTIATKLGASDFVRTLNGFIER
jgi:hypothetical protein